MAVKPIDGSPPLVVSKATRRKEHSRYDQDLFRAKKDGTMVKFAMACDWYLADEDGCVVGLIEQVDRYDIEIRVDGVERVWLKKAMIASTRVLR